MAGALRGDAHPVGAGVPDRLGHVGGRLGLHDDRGPLVHGQVPRLPGLDAAGLGLFAVTGASEALDLGLGAAPAVILGAVTGVGGGTLRDVLLGQIPSVLRRGLYAIPALCAAAITVVAVRAGIYGLPAAVGAVLACFLIRVLGVHYDLNAPMAQEPGQRTRRSQDESRGPGRGIEGSSCHQPAAARVG